MLCGSGRRPGNDPGAFGCPIVIARREAVALTAIRGDRIRIPVIRFIYVLTKDDSGIRFDSRCLHDVLLRNE